MLNGFEKLCKRIYIIFLFRHWVSWDSWTPSALDWNSFILHSQYHHCPWADYTKRKGVSGYVTDWLPVGYCGLSGIFYLTSDAWHRLVCFSLAHDDVIKWKHFPRYLPFVRGIHRSPVNPPHKGQWRGASMFALICVSINGWVSSGGAGDLRRYRAHHDVIAMRDLCEIRHG